MFFEVKNSFPSISDQHSLGHQLWLSGVSLLIYIMIWYSKVERSFKVFVEKSTKWLDEVVINIFAITFHKIQAILWKQAKECTFEACKICIH